MKAINIGKTIIVWDKLTDKQAAEIILALKNIILTCRQLTNGNFLSKPIPIALDEINRYLCVLQKHNEIMVCSTRIINNDGGHTYNYSAILNADYLYDSLPLLMDPYEELQNHINILQRFPQTKWIELPFSKSFEEYCLTPNMNPQNFIHHLENGTLSDTSKDFLRNIGFALEENNFTEELQNTIKEANDLFIER